MEINKKQLLAEYLEADIEDIEEGYDGALVFGDSDYYVLTDEEADKKAEQYILDTAWAFNSWFLSKHTDLDEDLIEIIQKGCESSNDAILKLINDKQSFIDEAIGYDGRGHFIAFYDHNENEYKDHYIYRQ
jgi:hypothetical protein